MDFSLKFILKKSKVYLFLHCPKKHVNLFKKKTKKHI